MRVKRRRESGRRIWEGRRAGMGEVGLRALCRVMMG